MLFSILTASTLFALALGRPQHTNLRLIKTGEDTPAQWLKSAEILELYRNDTHFIDITNHQDLGKAVPSLAAATQPKIPSAPTHVELTKSIISIATKDSLLTNLKELTKYPTRYYESESGAQASGWLFDKVSQLAQAKGALNITVRNFRHDWKQATVIARIEGSNNNQETVILGSHLDSINIEDPEKGIAPGADDDGSGVVVLLETLRAIISKQYQPQRPIEFHWYSAEESGLLGSQDVVQSYKNSNRIVAGMMQIDMAGHPNPDNKDIGITTDNTDAALNNLVRSLVKSYSSVPSHDFQCGYACSDHASWHEAGYPSAMPFEASRMPLPGAIHNGADTIDKVDMDHVFEFVKLAVAFAVEMSSGQTLSS